MAGYTPEEIAALRSKLVGSSSVGEFDRKAADVSRTVERLPDYFGPRLARSLAGNPLGIVAQDVAADAVSRAPGGAADLSTRTQEALADRVTSPGGTILRPLDSPVPQVDAAPSLKDQLLSKLRGGVGGGGDPLANLRSAYWASKQKQLGDFDTDKALAGQLGNQKASHVMGASQMADQFAARQERDAQIQAEAEEKAHQEHQAFLARNQELADDIGRQKIDPKRLAKSMGTGEKIGHILDSALGGFAAGFRGGSNDALDRFDKLVAQDIQAQINEVDNKKAALGASQNIFGQMLAESGDRRLAAVQTRNLMYEAAKQHIAAEDARLGIPELSTNAQQAIQALQHQQDAMNTQMSTEKLQLAQQQAAAAAAAQRAAEQQAWNRQMELAKLGLERDKLSIEQMKALGMSGEDIQKQAQYLGEKLADPKLALGRAAVEASKSRLEKAAPGEGLPGVGAMADFREKVAGRPEGAAALLPAAWILNKTIGLNDEERVSRNDWAAVRQAYINQATGSGGSAEERADIIKTFQGAQTPAEQRNAIAKADAFFRKQEEYHKASVDPRARATVEGRLNSSIGVQPRQGNVSDERAKQFKRKVSGY